MLTSLNVEGSLVLLQSRLHLLLGLHLLVGMQLLLLLALLHH